MLKNPFFHEKRGLAKMAPPSFYAFMHKKRGENKLQLILPYASASLILTVWGSRGHRVDAPRKRSDRVF